MKLLAMLVILLPLKIWGQVSNKEPLTDNPPFKTIEQLLENSVKITSETFDMNFLIRALPDNGWFLKLNKDATFEYIHWSGYGSPEGTILEKGNYSITDNLLHLESENNKSDLEHIQFYLVSSQTEWIDDIISVDCQKNGELFYCLYRSY